MLAERFHMDRTSSKRSIAARPSTRPATAILVANVNVKPVALGAKAGKIEVDKAEQRGARARQGWRAARAYPASVGSEEKPAPSGTLKVVRVARNPTYTYDPEFKFKGVKADEKLHIAAGPNNPVGSVWIALNQKTYGIHGTSEPSKVGKVDSHGCVRLTNWDALALAKMVRKGTPVEFID